MLYIEYSDLGIIKGKVVDCTIKLPESTIKEVG